MPCQFLKGAVEMPDGAKARCMGDFCNGHLLLRKHRDSLCDPDDIYIGGKRHAGYPAEVFGEIGFAVAHERSSFFKCDVCVPCFNQLQKCLVFFTAADGMTALHGTAVEKLSQNTEHGAAAENIAVGLAALQCADDFVKKCLQGKLCPDQRTVRCFAVEGGIHQFSVCLDHRDDAVRC